LKLNVQLEYPLIVADTTKLEQDVLKRILCIEQYNPFRRAHKIVRVNYFWKDKFFPFGLLELVLANCRKFISDVSIKSNNSRRKASYELCIKNLLEKGIGFKETIENEKQNVFEKKSLGNFVLRDYQIDAINSALWMGNGILRIPTGGGKTLIAGGILSYYRKGLVIIHGRDLIAQTIEKLKDYLKDENISVGELTAGKWVKNAQIIVSSVDTLYRRKDTPEVQNFLNFVSPVILDECHRASSWSWLKVLKKVKTTKIFAMSGTPFNKSDLRDISLQSVAGSMVYDLPITTLQKSGYLAKAVLLWVNTDDCNVPVKSYDWTVVKQEAIIQNWKRNNKITEVVKKFLGVKGGILVLVGNSVEYGEILDAKFKDNGIKSCFVSGRDSLEVRKNVFDQLRAGKIPVVISTVITDEGLDFPALGVVVLAYGGKSFVKLMQRIGRGLRPKENPLIVVDFKDTFHKFLRNQTNRRVEIYEEEKCFSEIKVLQ